MIYCLAALPEASFDVLRDIFLLFSKADLKGQGIPHSKKGIISKPPDLKASNFKCLKGIELPVGHRLLQNSKKSKHLYKKCLVNVVQSNNFTKYIKVLLKVLIE